MVCAKACKNLSGTVQHSRIPTCYGPMGSCRVCSEDRGQLRAVGLLVGGSCARHWTRQMPPESLSAPQVPDWQLPQFTLLCTYSIPPACFLSHHQTSEFFSLDPSAPEPFFTHFSLSENSMNSACSCPLLPLSSEKLRSLFIRGLLHLPVSHRL